MKKIFYGVFLLFIFQLSASAQVPNGGFENWTGGNPDNWLTNNLPGVVVPVTQTSDSHSGSSALRGEVVSGLGSIYAPLIISVDQSLLGFPVNVRYNSMKAYLKFAPVEGDMVELGIALSLNAEYIGGGFIEISDALSGYTEINVPIEYSTAGIPDTAIIYMSVIGPPGGDFHLGTVFYADDISLSEAIVGVNDNNLLPAVYNLEQNYPNPFNPSTTISFGIPERSFVSLKIYNILGSEIAELVNETMDTGLHSVSFDASSHPSGVYLYKLQAGNFTSTKKMILTK